MFHPLLAFLSALHLFATIVTAGPTPGSNGDRLARGLPPLPPKFRRTLPGNAQVGRFPTPVAAAKRSVASTGLITYNGRLEIRSSSGSSLGFVRNTPSSNPIGGVNLEGPDQDLQIKFTTTPNGVGPFDILSTNPSFPAPLYVGAAGTNNINSNSANYLSFSNVPQTAPQSIPLLDVNGVFVESAIWSIDPASKKLTAQYINANGHRPATYLAYDIRANALLFVGDIAAYNKKYSTSPVSGVDLYLSS
jgi:hypothetical protein